MPRGIPKYGSKYVGQFTLGQLFGRWTVVNLEIAKRDSNAMILVRCTCGTERMVQCSTLLKGKSNGCECVYSGNKSAHWTGTKDIPGTYLSRLKIAAQKRNLRWEITYEYLQRLLEDQNYKCALSGVEIEFSYKSIRHTASLDRIDMHKGYVEGNLQWTHKHINIMKNIFSNHDFVNWCKLVYDYCGNKFETPDVSKSGRSKKLFRGTKSKIKE